VPGWFPSVAFEAAVAAVAILAFGYLLTDALAGRSDLDAVDRWALAFPAFLAYAFLLTIAHIASGGRVLSHPWLVRGITAGLAVALAVHRVRAGRRPARAGVAVALAAALLVGGGLAVWATPVARLVPLVPTAGDDTWHLGWAGQLQNGETTPSAVITGDVPNYYPWMFHGLTATVADLLPGARAFDAVPPLQLAEVAAAVLGLFALGRFLGGGWVPGATTALLGALTGGIGFLVTKRFDLITHLNTELPGAPKAGRYLGDLLFVRSYNGAYANLAPPFPRDIGYALFPVLLLLLALGVTRKRREPLLAAGVLLGLIGLTSGEWFLAGLAVTGGLLLFPGEVRRRTIALAVLGPSLGLYLLWLVPLALSYLRLGGFVNTTVGRGLSLPAVAILGSWAVVIPFAALAGYLLWRRVLRPPAFRVVALLVAAAASFLVAGQAVPALLGEGFTPIGRAHRYWPILEFGLAIAGGLGAAWLLERARRFGRWLPVALSTVVVLVAVSAPLVASLALPDRAAASTQVAEALLGNEPSLFGLVAEGGHRRCVVAAPVVQSFQAFAFTGYRFVSFRTSRLQRIPGNLSRIRWRDIYERIPGDAERLSDQRELVTGVTGTERWRSLVGKYDVDIVVVADADAGAAPFLDLDLVGVAGGYHVFRVRKCPGP